MVSLNLLIVYAHWQFLIYSHQVLDVKYLSIWQPDLEKTGSIYISLQENYRLQCTVLVKTETSCVCLPAKIGKRNTTYLVWN